MGQVNGGRRGAVPGARPVEKDRDVAKTRQIPGIVFKSGSNSGSDYGLSFQA